MKLYTKRGDAGETDLFGSTRIDKDAPRIDAIGAVDEANNSLGWARVALTDDPLASQLTATQAHLFDLGADLANPNSKAPRITPEHAAQLEAWIDAADVQLDPMRHFILPGGSEAAARLHLARGIVRSAERCVVTLARSEPVTPDAIIYLNRLSDYLFAAARLANHLANVPDVPWNPRGHGHGD